ncbi:aquaporin [Agromyces endophyticus]|uniref:aquaporin n=1 Tax=Agromyces sp. H17E-10 TaxID=2932244 RepID=UPI001FD4297B|nr:aquaporin [Agromyces sp. H17E-10]UOQ89793.1 aquaporin [Agromyces sp. H17E-10]
MSDTAPAQTSAPAPAVAGPSTGQKLTAELLGTFILVFGVIGAAIFSSAGTGLLGVAFALGLAVLVGIYAFGPISGGHFNPAVTLGLAIAGRFAWKDTLGYIVAQIVGGILGSVVLLGILSTGPKFDMAIFQSVSTGYDELSPGGFGLVSFLIAEIVATAVFLFVILGVTSAGRAASNLAPLAIGLTLTVLVLVAGNVSNGSFNPARSIATAIFGGPVALSQLWASIVAPIVGALLAGVIYKALFDRPAQLTK